MYTFSPGKSSVPEQCVYAGGDMKYIGALLLMLAAQSVFGQDETLSAPSLGEWGVVAFVGLLTFSALFFMRRKSTLH